MSSTDAYGATYWGWLERYLIVFTVISIAAVQTLLLGEVFTDPPTEFVAATGALYGSIGVFFHYLVAVIFAGLVLRIVHHAREYLTGRQVVAIRTVVWAVVSVFMLSVLFRSTPATEGYPELAMIPDVFAVCLALVAAERAVPRFVWRRLYRWWLFRDRDPEVSR